MIPEWMVRDYRILSETKTNINTWALKELCFFLKIPSPVNFEANKNIQIKKQTPSAAASMALSTSAGPLENDAL